MGNVKRLKDMLTGVSVCNLVICFDGTWNTENPDTKDNEECTNVLKLHDALCADEPFKDDSGDTELTYEVYVEGPGTAKGNKLKGGLFAADLDQPVKEGYRELVKAYNICRRAGVKIKIYLFGFSRGAYICHVFSWLLYRAGVAKLLSDSDGIVDAFMQKDADRLDGLQVDRVDDSPSIAMMGLWDVVSSQNDRYRGFFNGLKSPLVERIYHAMAADERRRFFPVMHYLPEDGIEQVWFSGVHSEVGGGYADDKGMSRISLAWMMNKASVRGLKFKDIVSADDVDFAAIEKSRHHPFGEAPYQVRYYWPLDRIHESIKKRASKTFYALQLENFESNETNWTV